jgi:hypothetical protein
MISVVIHQGLRHHADIEPAPETDGSLRQECKGGKNKKIRS